MTHSQAVGTRLGAALGAIALVAAAAATLRGPAPAEARPAPRATPAAAQPRTGAQIFATTCAACHQAQGQGTDMYPPLAGSEWVTGPESRLIRVILHGLTGDIDVEGSTYSGAMPAWEAILKDEEVAAVATYIRSSWGNKAPAVTTAAVAQLRATHAARKTPWTAAELAKAGIPVKK